MSQYHKRGPLRLVLHPGLSEDLPLLPFPPMKSCLFVLLLSLLARTLPAATLVIPDTGWRLWPDTQAAWKNDTLYLPDDVDLAHMPVNAPTGGWDALSSSQGITGAGSACALTRRMTIPMVVAIPASRMAITKASHGGGATSRCPPHTPGSSSCFISVAPGSALRFM